MTEIIKAFFDSRVEATKAIEDLVAAGISRSAVTLLPDREAAEPSREVGSFDNPERGEGGFWASLMRLFTADEGRGVYEDSMGRSGTLLHIAVEPGEVDLVQTVLDEHDAVDITEPPEAWRQAGWIDAVPVDGAQAVPAADSPTSAVPVTGATGAGIPAMPAQGGRFEAPQPPSSTAASGILERMEVIAADGTRVGTVDHLDGRDQIKLAKNTSPDGRHHYVPLAWVDHVDAHVHLTKAAPEVRASW